jgi:hypothetical protein
MFSHLLQPQLTAHIINHFALFISSQAAVQVHPEQDGQPAEAFEWFVHDALLTLLVYCCAVMLDNQQQQLLQEQQHQQRPLQQQMTASPTSRWH